MALVTSLLPDCPADAKRIPVRVDRYTLEKRRWRSVAEDGTDIAVDLKGPCGDGDVLLTVEGKAYFASQDPEEVIEVRLPDDLDQAARMGWFFGNQHLSVEILDGFMILALDQPLRKRLDHSGISYQVRRRVFRPDPHSRVHHHH
jgi:urease accessory protein UreE